ncbi:MAG: hypothetical protein KatS3mg131_2184 [Candidatus Tectimicrobiota bacterium]|nr:MAG: hypothetical protein KatS3mg131_2184 [Candidatus Tectomicrobia bacterium]
MWPCLLLALLAGACAPVPPVPPAPSPEAKTVYVVGHGWHTGIVVRRADIPPGRWPEHRDLPDTAYLEVGWGDKAFYMAPRPSLGLALKAALHPTPSVLYVVGFDASPRRMYPQREILAISLPPQGLGRLLDFIHETYQHDAAGQPLRVGQGPRRPSAFYLARGSYHLFNTCNTWVAKALLAAGCPMRPAWAFTAGSLLAQARRCGTPLPPG